MRNFRLLATLAAAIALAAAPGWGQEVLDFEGFAHGASLSAVYAGGGAGSGPIMVTGENPSFVSGTNAALAFNSAAPTFGYPELGSPNEFCGGPGLGWAGEPGQLGENCNPLGNVAIVGANLVDVAPQDGLVDEPAPAAGLLRIDFSPVGTVTLFSMALLNLHDFNASAEIHLFDANGLEIGAPAYPPAFGPNSVFIHLFDRVSGVARLEVVLPSGSAIDEIVFQTDQSGTDGCTPGFWKNHAGTRSNQDNWWELAGLAIDDSFNATFGVTAFTPDMTLYDAVRQGGGGVKALGRHAVAALLNASHPYVAYPESAATVIALVQAALAPGGDIEGTKDVLAGDNELGCPLGGELPTEPPPGDGGGGGGGDPGGGGGGGGGGPLG